MLFAIQEKVLDLTWCALQFLQDRAAALADRGIGLVLAKSRGIIPAAFALGSIGLLHLDVYTAGPVARALRERNYRNNEEEAKLVAMTRQD